MPCLKWLRTLTSAPLRPRLHEWKSPQRPALETDWVYAEWRVRSQRNADRSHGCPRRSATPAPSAVAAQTVLPNEDPVASTHAGMRRPFEDTPVTTEDAGPAAKKAKVNNTVPVGTRLQTFLRWAPTAQRALFVREAPPPLPHQCPSPHHLAASAATSTSKVNLGDASLFRCFDCYHAQVVCRPCIVLEHVQNPFHRVEACNSSLRFWERQSLGSLGDFVINLGHGGEPCSRQWNERQMTITHEHGIVPMKVRFCACPTGDDRKPVPDSIQLLRFGLFPGTWTEPRSAYTITGLRDYDLLSAQCQISTWDFSAYLRRSTDNVAPDSVKDRHRELSNTMREFMFLRATRRAGVEPTIPLDLGSLMVLCPACPQKDMNMDPRWKDRPLCEQHKDMFFSTTDGNFQNNLKDKPFDESDFSMTNGGGALVEQEDFKKYKAKVKPEKDDTTCHKFGAMGYSRFTGRLSGMVGLSCARHMFVMPNGTVDITGRRGKFRGRIKDIQTNFPNLLSIRLDYLPFTLPGIGKFHAPAHTVSCRCKYSYNYLPGVGMTDGEAAERIWAILNHLAARTKEMSPGHRHDVINHFYNDMNVRRLHGISNIGFAAALLLKRWLRARDFAAETHQYLMTLEQSIPPTILAEWHAQEAEWKERVLHIEEEINLESPYELKQDKALSDKELLMKITRERTLTGETASGVIGIVQRAVSLTEEREALLDAIDRLPFVEPESELDERCQQFHTEVERWEVLRDTYLVPIVHDAAKQVEEDVVAKTSPAQASSSSTTLPPADSPSPTSSNLPPTWPWRSTVEDTGDDDQGLPPPRVVDGQCEHWRDVFQTSIALPSTYHSLITSRSCMRSFVELETDFRRAEALNKLEDVRPAVITREVIKLHKLKFTGKSITTRNRSMIQEAEEGVTQAANRYRRHWVALRALGLEDTSLRPLAKGDLARFDLSTERDLGKSKRQTSWIWENFSFVDSEADDRSRVVYDDARRVHWFCSSALYTRWKEELDIVDEEMKRTVRFFMYWERRDGNGEDGGAAYACRQAYRYTRLLNGAREKFSPVINLDKVLVGLSEVE
ncbi:hypothetical protein C8T65DRAFT_695089 [Cerioporus squamosus]|nr:hypothetical protein C8T65DRAFT_695089 [Cerioporus squamosus]